MTSPCCGYTATMDEGDNNLGKDLHPRHCLLASILVEPSSRMAYLCHHRLASSPAVAFLPLRVSVLMTKIDCDYRRLHSMEDVPNC
jgi:hypothetical protein